MRWLIVLLLASCTCAEPPAAEPATPAPEVRVLAPVAPVTAPLNLRAPTIPSAADAPVDVNPVDPEAEAPEPAPEG